MEQKYCQSCGMPLSDEILGTNADGSKSQDYCIYCYKNGAFTGNFTMEDMAEYCSMFVESYNRNTGSHLTACEYKKLLLKLFPSLKRWSLPSDQIPHADNPLKQTYINEVNALGIKELKVTNLYVLQGSFVNQAYNLNGNNIKVLDDNAIYWGNQVQKSDGRCYGIACDEKYILVSEYGKDGADPEIVMLKKR